MCRLHRDRITAFDQAMAGLDSRISGLADRWQREAALLACVTGGAR